MGPIASSRTKTRAFMECERVAQPAVSGSPPHAPNAKSAIEIESSLAIQFRRHVLLLRYLLLDGELLIALVLRFTTYVSDAFLFIFVDVKHFAVHGCTLNLVSWQRRIDFLLFRCFRCANAKAGGAEERFGVR